jgi:hypothetical protein
VLDDVADAVIDALDAPFAPGSAALLRLQDAANVAVRNCRPPAGTEVFLALAGDRTKSVTLSGNDFAGVETICSRAPETPATALTLWSNHTTR